jgi:hypothetical protein
MSKPWQLPGLVSMAAVAAVGLAGTAAATPAPGTEVDTEDESCTAGFAAQGPDGGYYLLTSGHCDAGDGSEWTDAQGNPLGRITASIDDGDQMDASIIRLDPGTPAPSGGAGGYPIRDVLAPGQLATGMPFCKIGAVTGETCGVIKSVDGNVVEASVFSLEGDSGSPGFVKNPDGTVSAVGLLSSSPEGDDYTTYFIAVQPVLAQWGLQILP